MTLSVLVNFEDFQTSVYISEIAQQPSSPEFKICGWDNNSG
jgi:hypothetical protein